MTSTNLTSGPNLAPPAEATTADTQSPGSSAPTLTEAHLAEIIEESVTAPTLTPPSAAEAAAEAGVTATWRSNVRIDALWSIDETRNAFAHVTGLGWRKLFNGRDGAFQALVSLASQARQTNRPVNLREEADGMIYEIYLW